MNLKRVYLNKDEDTYVVTSGFKFLGVFNNEAVYETEPYRGEHEAVFFRKFRRDASDNRPGEFVSMTASGDAVSVITRPWWRMERAVTINDKERTWFIGHIQVNEVTADGVQIELCKEWRKTGVQYDSVRNALKYPNASRVYPIGPEYYAYVYEQ